MGAVRIWDLPTRLFHWLFAVSCSAAWVSGDDPRYTDLHLFAGYVALGLVFFRLLWGFTGGKYSRFAQFVRGPSSVRHHLSHLLMDGRQHQPGHNPAGGWAIVTMLGLVLVLAATGLVVLGGEEGFGPMSGLFVIRQGVAVHEWHEALAWVLLAVVVLHLTGVAVESLLQRQNLPLSMITGLKVASNNDAEKCNATATGGVLLLTLGVFSAIWFFPYLQGSDDQPYLPFVSAQIEQYSQWQESCSECHMAYPPSLLPARSWERMLAEQDDHFGEDLFLTPETVAALLEYAKKNSAEQVHREVSWRTLQSLAAEESPLRITESPYWRRVHQDIDASAWELPSVNGKFDCGACHLDALQGGFMNGAMRLPKK